MRITLTTIAIACHNINKAYCEAMGDTSQPSWHDAPEATRDSARNGVALHVTDPNLSPSASHEAWMLQKTRGASAWKTTPRRNSPRQTPLQNGGEQASKAPSVENGAGSA